MTTKNPITVSWLRGFFETDGSFQIHISKNLRKPLAKFSQKTNSNLLSLIQDFLLKNGINSIINDYRTNSGASPSDRAPDLLITGINNVKNFVKLLKSENRSHTFIGQKQRDLLIMEELISNTELTKAQMLGLKKSLHKSKREEPDLVSKTTVTRQEWEARLSVEENDSIIETEPILQRIDEIYISHQKTIEQSMENNTLSIEPDYITGLIDGDGGYSVSFFLKEPSPKYNKKHVEWQNNLSFTMEKGSILTILVLRHLLGSSATISKKGMLGGGLEVLIRNNKEMSKLIEIHNNFPLLGNYRQQQYATVITLRQSKTDNSIRNFELACNLVKEIYRVSSISSGGRPRQFASVEEAIGKIREYWPWYI